MTVASKPQMAPRFFLIPEQCQLSPSQKSLSGFICQELGAELVSPCRGADEGLCCRLAVGEVLSNMEQVFTSLSSG